MIKFRHNLVMLLLIVFTFMCLVAEAKSKQPVVAEKDEFKKVEVGFFCGLGTPQFDFKNSISDSYSHYWYDESRWYWDEYYYYWYYWYTSYDVTGNYSSSIVGNSKRKGLGFGGFFNYFFHKNFGLQLMLESSNYDIPVEASHSVEVSSYSYLPSGINRYKSAEPSINDTTGSLAVMPISFNVITRFDIGDNIGGYVSGGLTYYKVDIKAESKGGYGLPYSYYSSSYDLWYLWYGSVLIPVNIDDSFSGTGGNVGGGFSFQIQKNFGIAADFRYYLAPKKDVSWIPKAGNYKEVLYELDTLSITQDDINTFLDENERSLQVEVDPSYYRFAFGLLFRF